MKPSTLVYAFGLAVLVMFSLLTDTWVYLLLGTGGIVFAVFGVAHPKPALFLWLLLAPALNTYATVNLPVGLPDIMFSRVAVAVVAAALLLRMVLHGRRLTPLGRIELVMLGLLAIMTLDILRSGSPTSDALQDFDERVVPVLLFFVARNLFGRLSELKQVAYILTIVGCYLALHGGFQYFTYGRPDPTAATEDLTITEGGDRVNESHLSEGRAVGPFTSAVEYGSVGAIAFLSALFLALHETVRWRRLVLFGLLPFIGASVVMCSTRSVWLGAYAGVLVMAVLDQRRRTRLIGAIAALTIAGAAAAALLLPADSNLEERASSVEPIQARLAMYDVGVRIAARRLLIGYGRGAPSRIAARTELYATSNADAAEFAPGQFHNIFLMTLVEWGIAALVAYVALLFLIARSAARLRRGRRSPPDLVHHFAGLFLGIMTVFVTQGLFADIPPFLYLNGVFFFLAGVIHAQLDRAAGAVTGQSAAA